MSFLFFNFYLLQSILDLSPVKGFFKQSILWSSTLVAFFGWDFGSWGHQDIPVCPKLLIWPPEPLPNAKSKLVGVLQNDLHQATTVDVSDQTYNKISMPRQKH